MDFALHALPLIFKREWVTDVNNLICPQSPPAMICTDNETSGFWCYQMRVAHQIKKNESGTLTSLYINLACLPAATSQFMHYKYLHSRVSSAILWQIWTSGVYGLNVTAHASTPSFSSGRKNLSLIQYCSLEAVPYSFKSSLSFFYECFKSSLIN